LPRGFEDDYTISEFYLLMDRWKEDEYGHEYRASIVAVCSINPHIQEQLPLDYFIRPYFRPEHTNDITPEQEQARQQNIINVMQACGLKLETITEGMD